MILSKQSRSFFIAIGTAVLLSAIVVFCIGTADSLAGSTMNRVESISKNIEGKTQEAIGNLTGDPKDRLMGKAKQVESQARNVTEDLKDKMELQGRAKAVAKNIEGKAQEALGKATGNRQEQVAGKAKQVESQIRNAAEDVKDTFHDILK